MAYNGDPEKDLMCQYFDWDKKSMSLATLLDAVENAYNNASRNGKDPRNVPVVIEFDNLKYSIPWYGFSLGVGRKGCAYYVKSYASSKIMPVVEDKRPDDGEYWNSRGFSDFDCSGFVVSKAAGERLRRMVRLVLEKDEIESWLDWREYEPNWIQFKFNAKEFDVKKLDELARNNNNIVTIDILKECVIKN